MCIKFIKGKWAIFTEVTNAYMPQPCNSTFENECFLKIYPNMHKNEPHVRLTVILLVMANNTEVVK